MVGYTGGIYILSWRLTDLNVLPHIFIIYKQFNIFCFIAVAYTTLDRLCAFFNYLIRAIDFKNDTSFIN